mmetsp:Transcript_48359/g.94866  ORF Transcript_48359/g.94866 Transcript_48359/m.94866 type:complete len:216 (+) Transcript_48359:788-1435(+)
MRDFKNFSSFTLLWAPLSSTFLFPISTLTLEALLAATLPLTPRPSTAEKLVTAGRPASWPFAFTSSATQTRTWLTMLAANGWEDLASTAATHLSKTSVLTPEPGLQRNKSDTANRPSVSVPVLSKPMALRDASVSRVATDLMIAPRRAALAIALKLGIGAAIVSAHGQAEMSRTNERDNHTRYGVCEIMGPRTATATAAATTTGVYTLTMRSNSS